MAISGTTALVGTNGRAYLFTEIKGAWTRIAELKGAGTRPGDGFGSVALWGVTAVVGASQPARGAGVAYVFAA